MAKKADGAKAKKKPKTKGSAKTKKPSKNVESLAKLAESPIVGDLIAVGATAAVAAIAASLTSNSKSTSTKAVKEAGKAAAVAIGARLLEEYRAVRESAEEAKKA